jgi:hypothetical protein
LRDAVHRHGRPALGARDRLAALFQAAAARSAMAPGPDLAELRAEVRQVRDVIRRGAELCSGRGTIDPARADRLERVRSSVYRCRRLAPLLDAFNQLGNLAFLRGRAALEAAGRAGAQAPDRRSLYLAYFGSLEEALQPIADSLERLDRIARARKPLAS